MTHVSPDELREIARHDRRAPVLLDEWLKLNRPRSSEQPIDKSKLDTSEESDTIDPRGHIAEKNTEERNTKRRITATIARDYQISPKDVSLTSLDAFLAGLASEPALAKAVDTAARQEGPWVKRLMVSLDEAIEATRPVIPAVAPALWKEDRLPTDTPPGFIKRHYGDLLRADGTGLMLKDFRRLDSAGYLALSLWLRAGNEMPEDCPLPKKSAVLDGELRELTESGKLSEHLRHQHSLLNALRHRRSR